MHNFTIPLQLYKSLLQLKVSRPKSAHAGSSQVDMEYPKNNLQARKYMDSKPALGHTIATRICLWFIRQNYATVGTNYLVSPCYALLMMQYAYFTTPSR